MNTTAAFPRLALFLADGFEEVEALTVVDLLRRAGISVTTVSITDRREVTSSHQVTLLADTILDELDFDALDGLVLPGGMPGTTNLAACAPLTAQIQKFAADGREVCAICAAPTILAALGLLEGKPATCFPAREPDMRGAILTHAPQTVTGNIITGRSMGCAIDFALAIVEHYQGRDAADRLKQAVAFPY
ncbi:MAG: DJ-1/PfpI family protein [Firmicutes bacterium]|jgi:4-methyl-5(b-hydroxyethyl)-thiazole monophosphate biosynthesis|nr:DJ-1/PfpI family protein [Bacillota bacterium]